MQCQGSVSRLKSRGKCQGLWRIWDFTLLTNWRGDLAEHPRYLESEIKDFLFLTRPADVLHILSSSPCSQGWHRETQMDVAYSGSSSDGWGLSKLGNPSLLWWGINKLADLCSRGKEHFCYTGEQTKLLVLSREMPFLFSKAKVDSLKDSRRKAVYCLCLQNDQKWKKEMENFPPTSRAWVSTQACEITCCMHCTLLCLLYTWLCLLCQRNNVIKGKFETRKATFNFVSLHNFTFTY